jgi:hypothetical protein
MNSSTFHRFAIIWLALWFGVIVPGHKRGLVLLPGGGERAASTTVVTQDDEPCPLAQMMAVSGKCCPSSRTPSQSSPGGPASHCAVCYITGVLDVPLPPDFAPRPLELIQILPWPKPVTVASAPTTHIYQGRAPPTSLA